MGGAVQCGGHLSPKCNMSSSLAACCLFPQVALQLLSALLDAMADSLGRMQRDMTTLLTYLLHQVLKFSFICNRRNYKCSGQGGGMLCNYVQMQDALIYRRFLDVYIDPFSCLSLSPALILTSTAQPADLPAPQAYMCMGISAPLVCCCPGKLALHNVRV